MYIQFHTEKGKEFEVNSLSFIRPKPIYSCCWVLLIIFLSIRSCCIRVKLGLKHSKTAIMLQIVISFKTYVQIIKARNYTKKLTFNTGSITTDVITEAVHCEFSPVVCLPHVQNNSWVLPHPPLEIRIMFFLFLYKKMFFTKSLPTKFFT